MSRRASLALAVAAVAFGAGAASAQVNNWNKTTGGSATTTSNWSLNHAPQPGDENTFDLSAGSFYNVNLGSNVTSTKLRVGDDFVNLTFTNSRTWTLDFNTSGSGSALVLGLASGDDSRLTIKGNEPGVEGFLMGTTGQNITIGSAAGSTGTLNLQDGGNINFNGPIVVGNNGNGNFNIIDSGTAITGPATVGNTDAGGSASISGAGSSWMVNGALNVGTNAGGTGVIAVGSGASLIVNGGANLRNGNISVSAGSTYTVTGATSLNANSLILGNTSPTQEARFNTGSLSTTTGIVNWRSGTVRVTGSTLAVGPGTALGSPRLSPNHHLDVTQTLQINSNGTTGMIVLQGGSLKAGQIVNNGQLRSDVNNALVTAPSVINNNSILGSMRLTGNLTNAAAGSVMNGAGSIFEIDGSTTNSGMINANGGTFRFDGPATNNANATITAKGASVHFNGGATNNGHLIADVTTGSQFFGSIKNNSMIRALGASPGANVFTATFNGPVDNDSIVQVDEDVLFKGNVTGTGDFKGSNGHVVFEGTYDPDSLPEPIIDQEREELNDFIAFEGDLTTRGANGRLLFELGGTSAGDEYDNINVFGEANLHNVDVVLIGGFVPQVGDEFVLVSTEGGINYIGGTREQVVSLPALPNGRFWEFCSQSPDCLTIKVVVPEPAAGGLLGAGLLALTARRRRSVKR